MNALLVIKVKQSPCQEANRCLLFFNHLKQQLPLFYLRGGHQSRSVMWHGRERVDASISRIILDLEVTNEWKKEKTVFDRALEGGCGLLTEQVYTIEEAARNLGTDATVLGRWKRKHQAGDDNSGKRP